VLGTAFINGTLTYWNTGERPHGKDYWAFRDGTKDANGNWNRHLIPGYLMKDIYSWSHHPVQTFKNKLAPTLAFMMRLAENRDYFGDMIYDEEGTRTQKAKQIAKAVAKQHAPLSLQNYLEGRKRGEKGASELSRNVFGVTPAKRELVRTPAENLMADYASRKGHTARTPEEVENADVHRLTIEAVRKGEMLPDKVIKAVEAGKVKRETLFRWIAEAKDAPTVRQFKALTLEQAKKVYELGNEQQKAVWADAYRTKLVNAAK
jgi:hypothetical protein